MFICFLLFYVVFRILVEGLSTIPVGSFHDIQLRIKEGDRQRTIAATKMNETSRFEYCQPPFSNLRFNCFFTSCVFLCKSDVNLGLICHVLYIDRGWSLKFAYRMFCNFLKCGLHVSA